MVAAGGMTAPIQRAGPLRVGPVDSARDPQVHALFEKVFGTPKPPAWWHWKYGEGRGLAYGAWRDGALVAHYAAFPRLVYWQGKTVPVFQVGDVMVEPRERGVLTRKGAFQRCASAFLDAYLGEGRPYRLGYGFPNLRALKVAVRLELYAPVDRMREISWSLGADRPPPRRHRLQSFVPGRDAHLVVRLWSRMRRRLSEAIVGVRDFDYVRHRYLCHPEHRYRLYLLTDWFGLRGLGLIVVRREGDRWLWVDWIGAPEDMPTAVTQLRYTLAREAPGDCYTWVSTLTARWLAGAGGRQQPLDVYVPTGISTPGPAPAKLRERWWLMPGDTDFF